jgi:hypothetical protein
MLKAQSSKLKAQSSKLITDNRSVLAGYFKKYGLHSPGCQDFNYQG